MTDPIKKECRQRIRIIAFITYCVLAYPLNYFSMDNGWGFYDKNPKVTTTDVRIHADDGKTSRLEIMAQRMFLLVISPLATPINGLYMIIEGVTHIELKESTDATE